MGRTTTETVSPPTPQAAEVAPAEGDEDSPFDQMLTQQGPGPDQPEYGVQPWAQPDPSTLSQRGAQPETGYHPDLEYIRQFNTQNSILQNIYDALVGRGRPSRFTFELQLNTRRLLTTRVTLDNIVATNLTAAGVTATLTLGTRVYTFGLQAGQTLILPLPLVIEPGTDVTFTNASGWLVGALTSAEG